MDKPGITLISFYSNLFLHEHISHHFLQAEHVSSKESIGHGHKDNEDVR